ncbi:hypothetical protein GH714_001408 [Hevea brasiliensis]|uniref:Ankyrin repeat domain-containing protein n=1 Tax=Hevea brasiliensis TaxID=3981 RepID=A0A6A6KHD9_HEVBR|nr:hypothetical protein GH714_001408 [Hevea brasiliensis]
MEDISKYSHSPAHFAVARRDYAALRRIISTLPSLAKAGEINTEEESLAAEERADAVSAVIDHRDVPGRETPLHLAVKLRDPISAEILMAAGADWSLQNENARVRDFYMEITFHFESSVIPFIGRIAPSDTYRIWKRGSNLRADMTLAGFDGFRIQRSDQTFLFLGEGYSSEDSNISLPPASLIVLAHKEKEVTNALEGAGAQPTEAEVAHEVALMSQTNMYRPGIDVTQAELVPHLNWRRQERTEMVGNWKAKVYDMLHVMVSVKSRRVPGAMTDEELFALDDEERLGNGAENDEFDDVLTAEERKQLDTALRMGNSDGLCENEEHGVLEYQENGSGGSYENGESNGAIKEKKSWFGWKSKGSKNNIDDPEDSKILKKFSKLAPEGGNQKSIDNQKPSSEIAREELGDGKKERIKAARRRRRKGPVVSLSMKVAIPIVPTIRVLVTFTKFEELQPVEEFSTPLSSPAHFQDAKSKEAEASTSWISWMRGSHVGQSSDSDSHRYKDEVEPFNIPSDYTWVDANEKKRRMKAKKSKSKKHRKQTPARGGDGGTHHVREDVEE